MTMSLVSKAHKPSLWNAVYSRKGSSLTEMLAQNFES